jgi:hypothetical protein
MTLGPVGQILPGLVKVEEIISLAEDGPARWCITLVAQPGEVGSLPLLEATVKFVTADRVLVERLRQRRLKYALDLVQVVDSGENGELEIGPRPVEDKS